MKNKYGLLIVLNLVMLLSYMAYSTWKKEQILDKGQLVLLELAPVDPRSLMQGDYMRLRYALSEDREYLPKRGYCVVQLDEHNHGSFVRFQENKTPISANEQIIEYTASQPWSVNIGAESFFFQEGQGEKYEKAKYGGLKIDAHGNSILIGLYDENGKEIK